jgi:hypothetical protein
MSNDPRTQKKPHGLTSFATFAVLSKQRRLANNVLVQLILPAIRVSFQSKGEQ